MKSILIAGLFAVLASPALAHSPLEATSPANNAVVAQAPSEILLTFKGKIRLTRVRLTQDAAKSVDLDLSGHDGFISRYVLPVQTVGTGAYVIEWRGLGSDGHALKGTFSFSVSE